MKISNERDVISLKELIKNSLLNLKNKDINLFENASNNAQERKLHEICINHRLAVYIENHLKEKNLDYCVDIEYNKNHYMPKKLKVNGSNKKVRPDIIVHTRVEKINGLDKNYLIIESKKDEDSKEDEDKIKAFMKDDQYYYKFGCKIKYGNLTNDYNIKIYYSKDGNKIEDETISLE
jgi:hypothetical protein